MADRCSVGEGHCASKGRRLRRDRLEGDGRAHGLELYQAVARRWAGLLLVALERHLSRAKGT
jgi:hypothetical protein